MNWIKKFAQWLLSEELAEERKHYQKINRIAYSNHPLSSMPQGDKNMGQFFGCAMKEMNGLNDFVLDFNPGNANLKFRDKIGFDQTRDFQGNVDPSTKRNGPKIYVFV